MRGRGVAYGKTDETNLCWSATVETGGRGVAYCIMGLHGILLISTVDLLEPPRATVDLLQPPWAPVHPASTARLHHRLLFNHPSTGTPPPSTIHPSLHGVVLFIQRQRHGVLHPPPPLTVHPPPSTLTVHPIVWLQLAVVAKESLDWVQFTAIDRSLGFSNA